MKKTIASINAVNWGSTGNIMLQLSDLAEQKGYATYVAYGRFGKKKKKSEKNAIVIGSRVGRGLSVRISRVFGRLEKGVPFATHRFLKKLDQIKPDLVHLHNLHGGYIHIGKLFSYLKRHKIPVVWTLHDCWSFTGHCPYFTISQCEKWKTGCFCCENYKLYPQSYVDNSKWAWKYKKQCFMGVENLTVVTPSHWLADLVKESYLKDYPTKVIHNGINLEVFKPTPSDFRQKYGIVDDKRIVLGVSFGWGKRKGLDVFVDLAKRLDKEKYQIVLVGTNDALEKQLPDNILCIHRTHNQKELAEIYSEADLFVNPTREENFPTVNMEALACGTPVLTFRTGGSPESIDESCGSVVACDDMDAMEKEIVRICDEKPYSSEACVQRAKAFDMKDRFAQYMDLYDEILFQNEGAD
jgi:glycosyltransferase involved in cell wall biosynthesis